MLRLLEETVDLPRVIRSVGESPEQYPQWDDEDWDDDEDTRPFTPEEIEAFYGLIPLRQRQKIQKLLWEGLILILNRKKN